MPALKHKELIDALEKGKVLWAMNNGADPHAIISWAVDNLNDAKRVDTLNELLVKFPRDSNASSWRGNQGETLCRAVICKGRYNTFNILQRNPEEFYGTEQNRYIFAVTDFIDYSSEDIFYEYLKSDIIRTGGWVHPRTGKTALDYATEKGWHKVAKLILIETFSKNLQGPVTIDHLLKIQPDDNNFNEGVLLEQLNKHCFNDMATYRNSENKTLLHICAQRGYKRIAIQALKCGADPKLSCSQQRNVVDYANHLNNSEVKNFFKIAYDFGGDVCRNTLKLFNECEKGDNVEALSQLVDKPGIIKSMTDENNRSALQIAAEHGHLQQVRYLLDFYSSNQLEIYGNQSISAISNKHTAVRHEILKYMVTEDTNLIASLSDSSRTELNFLLAEEIITENRRLQNQLDQILQQNSNYEQQIGVLQQNLRNLNNAHELIHQRVEEGNATIDQLRDILRLLHEVTNGRNRQVA